MNTKIFSKKSLNPHVSGRLHDPLGRPHLPPVAVRVAERLVGAVVVERVEDLGDGGQPGHVLLQAVALLRDVEERALRVGGLVRVAGRRRVRGGGRVVLVVRGLARYGRHLGNEVVICSQKCKHKHWYEKYCTSISSTNLPFG